MRVATELKIVMILTMVLMVNLEPAPNTLRNFSLVLGLVILTVVLTVNQEPVPKTLRNLLLIEG